MAIKGQEITPTYYALDNANNVGKTNDATNHTLILVQDGNTSSPTNLPLEVDSTNSPGLYKITLTSSEMNYNIVTLSGKSSSADVQIIPVQIITEAGLLAREITLASKADQTSVDIILIETESHPTLSEIEGSTILAKESTLINKADQTSVDIILIETESHPTLSEIEGSTILARESTVLNSSKYRTCQSINSAPIFMGLTSDNLSSRDLIVPMRVCNSQGIDFTPTHFSFNFYNSSGILVNSLNENNGALQVINSINDPGIGIQIKIYAIDIQDLGIGRDANLITEYSLSDDSGNVMYGSFSIHYGYDRDLAQDSFVAKEATILNQVQENLNSVARLASTQVYRRVPGGNVRIIGWCRNIDGEFTVDQIIIGNQEGSQIELSTIDGDITILDSQGYYGGIYGTETIIEFTAQGIAKLDAAPSGMIYLQGPWSNVGTGKEIILSVLIDNNAVSSDFTLDSTDVQQIAISVWEHPTRSITQNGNGTQKVTLIITDTTSLIPIADVSITVRNSDDSMTVTEATTDTTGIAIVYLNDGNYILRTKKSMYIFPVNKTLSVVGDTTLAYDGSAIFKEVTVVPGLQTIYGRIIKIDGTPDAGQVVTAIVKKPKVIDNALLSRTRADSTTNLDGDFELIVVKGSTIVLSLTNYFSKEVIVTQDDAKDFIDYIS